jgi:hypothetical protein
VRFPPARETREAHRRSGAHFVCRGIPSRCPADDFEIGDLRQLGQDVVLHTIAKARVLSARPDFQTAERRFQLLPVPDQFTFPNDPPAAAASAIRDAASSALLGLRRTHFSSRENSSVPRLNRFVL